MINWLQFTIEYFNSNYEYIKYDNIDNILYLHNIIFPYNIVTKNDLQEQNLFITLERVEKISNSILFLQIICPPSCVRIQWNSEFYK